MPTGVNFKHKFSKAGNYKIICTLHERDEDEDQRQVSRPAPLALLDPDPELAPLDRRPRRGSPPS